jgi:hypothetical protein
MSGQIDRTGLRAPHGAGADIVKVTWRKPRKRFPPAFTSHRPPGRRSQRLAAHIGEMVVLVVVMLMLSGIVAAAAYMIVEMWLN